MLSGKFDVFTAPSVGLSDGPRVVNTPISPPESMVAMCVCDWHTWSPFPKLTTVSSSHESPVPFIFYFHTPSYLFV